MRLACYCLLLTVLLIAKIEIASAQNPICDPNQIPREDYITDFSEWNWEVPRSDPDFCLTWVGILSNGNALFLSSPWIRNSAPYLTVIDHNNDYRYVDGWRLIRMDFGHDKPVEAPYFVLYNVYRAVIRVYVFLIPGSVELNGSSIIMKQHFGNIGTIASFNPTLVRAPNKYLESNVSNTEEIAFSSGFDGNGEWVVGEFHTLLNPSIASSEFNDSQIEWEIRGLTNFDIELKGEFEFTTKPIAVATGAEKDGTFVNDAADLTKNIGKAFQAVEDQKGLDKKMTTGLKNIMDVYEKKKKTEGKVYKRLEKMHKSATDGSWKNFLKTVDGIANIAGPFFDIVGGVLGIFSGDEDEEEVKMVPTISEGTIELSGTMNSSRPISPPVSYVPGTGGSQRANNGDELPYYDCPLGIFNIERTPEVYAFSYDRLLSIPLFSPTAGEKERYTSYKVKDNIKVFYNAGVGLRLHDVKASLVGRYKPTETDPEKAVEEMLKAHKKYPVQLPGPHPTTIMQQVMNPILAEIDIDHYELIGVDDKGEHIFQTKKVPLECFRGVTFNVPERTEVWIKIDATLEVIATGEVVKQMINYEFNKIPGTPDNSNYNMGPGGLTPYSDTNLSLFSYYSEKVTGNISGQNGDITRAAVTELEVTGVNVSGGPGQITFAAGERIIFKSGTHIQVGSKFIAQIADYDFGHECGTLLSEGLVFNCDDTNDAAYRKMSKNSGGSENIELYLYPNPTYDVLNVNLNQTEADSYEVFVYQIDGRLKEQLDVDSSNFTISVNKYTPGIYLLKVMSRGTLVTEEKFVVQ